MIIETAIIERCRLRESSVEEAFEYKEKLGCAIADNRGLSINHDGDYTVAEWCACGWRFTADPTSAPAPPIITPT